MGVTSKFISISALDILKTTLNAVLKVELERVVGVRAALTV